MVIVLANLICASLREDPYGVAQGDIPKVLEAFVLYLMELEKVRKGLMSSVESLGVEEEKEEMAREIEGQIEPIESGTLLFLFLVFFWRSLP
jgi:nucleoporin NDC1